jgi:hypothetical protein
MKKFLACFTPAFLAGAFLVVSPISANAEDLLASLPALPNSTTLGQGDTSSGGQMARYSTTATPSAVIDSYKQALTTAGWTVAGGGGGGYGGGFQATSGPKYLTFNAGGPQGTTFVNLCVWPAKPKDDQCGGDDN